MEQFFCHYWPIFRERN